MAFRKKLRTYQRKAVRQGVKSGGRFAIHFKPGTGKTYTAIALAEKLGARNILIVCRKSALRNVWEKQINEFIRGRKVVYFKPSNLKNTKYQRVYTVLSHGGATTDIYTKLRKRYDCIIIDESHILASRGTRQSRRIKSICHTTPYVIELTGSPIRKDGLDLYGQYACIDTAEQTLIGSWNEFFKNYGIRGRKIADHVYVEKFNEVKLNHLTKRLAPYTAVADSSYAKYMPKELPTQFVDFSIPNKAVTIYKKVLTEMLYECEEEGYSVAPEIVLTRDLRLAQISAGFVKDDEEIIRQIHNAKIKAFQEWYWDFPVDEKLLIFYRFEEEANHIKQMINNIDFIKGKQTSKYRDTILHKFIGGDLDRLGAQIQAAGESIDGLQEACNYAMFYSYNYSFTDDEQAKGRIKRSGQKQPVQFYYMRGLNTLDPKIISIINDKASNSKNYYDAMKKFLV